MVICWFAGVYILTTRVALQAQDKVRSDLNSAREIYQNEAVHIRDLVSYAALAPYTAEAFARRKGANLPRIMSSVLKNENLDLLLALDTRGVVIYRAHNGKVSGDDYNYNPLVKQALKGKYVTGTVVLPLSRVRLEGSDIEQRARSKVLTTPHAEAGNVTEDGAAMFMVAAAPVKDEAGNIVGVFYGGSLLNNNNKLVDRIKSTLYEEGLARKEDVGASTIFMGDLRVATNVLTEKGARAIGTRMSAEVYKNVLLLDERWTSRAFVVNDWYFSAYEPIRSPEGVPIGALYVGMPEKPYTRLKFNLSLWISGVLSLGALIGFAVSSVVSTRLARPVRELAAMAKRVAEGERGIATRVASQDEIGELAQEFNFMSTALARQDEEIQELNRGLERKVLERTEELAEKNRILPDTQQELERVEKLAAIGELAAGVAHEINNPMAIIRGNTELIQETLPKDAPVQEELEIITRQLSRVELIVANLLRFARTERKQQGKAAINRILTEILSQIEHQVSLADITVITSMDPAAPEVAGAADQLQQVFTNIIINAVQAMPEGGTLTVATSADPARDIYEVTISDSGIGIPPESIEQIFDPFFTTRANGTGLGLSVSYSIIKDHGGELIAESSPGEGTSFRIILHQLLPAGS
ncbi:MAG: HAMP domain-containing protein [Geobacter sp.]|nr:HAMP domain-containing protein [Geobacter sp.]